VRKSDPVENGAVLGCYSESSTNSLRTFRDKLSVPPSSVKESVLTTDDGTDRLYRNVGKELPLLAAQ